MIAVDLQPVLSPDVRPLQRALETSCCVKLKGLPYSTSAQQIYDFFVGFDVKRIDFVLEPDGRPSGLAFAEFGSKEEALKALSKNGEYLGERYIRLLHVPRTEMEDQVRLGTLAVPGAAARMRSRVVRGPPQQALQPPGRGLMYVPSPMQLAGSTAPGRPMVAAPQQYQATLPDACLWNYSTGPQYAAGPATPVPPMQPLLAASQQQQELQQQQQQQMSAQHQHQYQPSPMHLAQQLAGLNLADGSAGAQASTGLPLGGSLMQRQPGQHTRVPHAITLHSPPTGTMLGLPPGAGAVRPLAPLQAETTTSPVVKIRGLPYRSSHVEIVAFFHGYSYIPDSLQIGLDQLGRPSGEAWLTFVNVQEALRAVRDLNRHYLGNRYLELSIC